VPDIGWTVKVPKRGKGGVRAGAGRKRVIFKHYFKNLAKARASFIQNRDHYLKCTEHMELVRVRQGHKRTEFELRYFIYAFYSYSREDAALSDREVAEIVASRIGVSAKSVLSAVAQYHANTLKLRNEPRRIGDSVAKRKIKPWMIKPFSDWILKTNADGGLVTLNTISHFFRQIFQLDVAEGTIRRILKITGSV
jgi:hypothetical protein